VSARPLPLSPSTPVADLLAAADLTPSAAARVIGVSRQAVADAVARGPGVTLERLTAWGQALGYVVEIKARKGA
jgi:plasmid maintenance system antidote protein VapI